jgi:hypothetical protein
MNGAMRAREMARIEGDARHAPSMQIAHAMKKRCWIPSNSALKSGTLCLDYLLVLHLQIRFAVHQN